MGRDTLKKPGFCPIMRQKNGPLSHFTHYKWLKMAHFVPLPYLAHNGQLCVIMPYLTAILAYFRHISRGRPPHIDGPNYPQYWPWPAVCVPCGS